MSKLIVICLVLGYLVFGISPVEAHVLESDGSVGAVMHIDPEDDPIVGQVSTFYFEIKDKTNKFSPQNCNCRVDIYEGDKIVYSDTLFQQGANNNINSPVFQYTFPQKDVYTVKVIGQPSSAGAFQQFTLSYDIRVSRESGQAANPSSSSKPNWLSTHIPHVIGAILVALFLIFALIRQMTKPKIQ